MRHIPYLTPGAVLAVHHELYWLAVELMTDTGCGWLEAQSNALDIILKCLFDVQDDVRYRPTEVSRG
jgi:hypothetical protein